MDSKSIYTNLCESRKSRISKYTRGSGLHAHHIIPRHMGGNDDSANLTYLTVREHILAHKLLWKIYKNPNDLRAMHMLGAKLTPEQRRITGEFCRDNNIGFFAASSEKKREWRKKGVNSQMQHGLRQSFWWWSTPEGRRERSSMGGKATQKSGNARNFSNMKKSLHCEIASEGGKSHKGKRAMYKPGDKSFIRVSPEDIDKKISEGFVFGSPHSPRKGKRLAWVHNKDLKKSKLIERPELDSYLSYGWSKGRRYY